ncbi:thioesterase family protein [Pseudoalteromonas sp. T1lg75]|uniref:thioesterase family protein n=1 Tax=Pseudoalteromonas sp. T1lg75 TaxID=2077102 RepID=UPI000CF74C3E|nr:thioesterase family protein [Pseudoalteromonas sp. T1lg75]
MDKSFAYEQLAQLFSQMPFNQLLGIEITHLDGDSARIHMPWRDELIGNPHQRILHGGVISTLLDTVGGLLAAASVVDKLDGEPIASLKNRLATLGTIDLRSDYLRPGKGERFSASAVLIRSGNKVCVCRMELHNEVGVQIAYGTGTYLVG